MNAPFTTPIRTAPHNIEAEQALLGAILVNNEAFYRASHSCRGRWSSAIINDPSYPICASPAQLSRTPTSCCLCFVRPTTTRCKSPMTIRNSLLGQLVPKSFITVLKLLLQSTVTVRPKRSN
jgi:hypothetical protein